MTISLTPLLTEIHDCDATTGWSAGAANTDYMLEGTGCLSLKVSLTTSSVAKYDQGGTGGVNMSGQHFYVWMMSLTAVDTIANGGLRIYLEDISGNYKTIYAGGSDNYGGGWQRFCCSADATNDGPSSGTYNSAQHRYVGVQFKTVGKSNANNCFWDFLHYGSGLRITSGATDQIGWQEIYDADQANFYGIISKSRGIFFAQGEIILGSTTAGLHIDFFDENNILQFVDNSKVESDLYKLTVEGNSTGTINVQFGSKAGTQGYGGGQVRGAQAWDFDVSDTNIDILKLYGLTCENALGVALPPDATGREVLNCVFSQCGEVLADTCVVAYCNFVDSDGDAVRCSSTSWNVTNCNFINCPDGVNVPTAGTYAFNALLFYTCTYDVHFSAASGDLIINMSNGSNASTSEIDGTGTVTLNNSITVTITCVDTNGDPVGDCRVTMRKVSDGTEVTGGLTNSSTGIYTDSVNNTSAISVIIKARKSSAADDPRYVPLATEQVLGTSNFSLTLTLQEDLLTA